MSITAQPIRCVGNTNPGNPEVTNGTIGEAATQTFKPGTPLAYSSGTYLAWAGADPSGAPAVLGVSVQGGQNLTVAGTAKPQSVSGTPVVNQSSALTMVLNQPVPLGGIPFYTFGNGNVFVGTFGNNGSAATPAVADVGVYYGMTIDSGSNYWYVDKNKSTRGTNTVVKVIGIYGIDLTNPASVLSITANTPVVFLADAAVVQS